MRLKLLPLPLLSLLFTACSFTNGINSFEDLYTDVKVVKPTTNNYKTANASNSAPIIKETHQTTTAPSQAKSLNIKKTGHIISTTYDPDLKLYLYTFLSQPEGEDVIFYYDQKLRFDKTNLIDIDVLDNYLIHALPHPDKKHLIAPQKKKYIKHKKINHNIREAIEEKINTF